VNYRCGSKTDTTKTLLASISQDKEPHKLHSDFGGIAGGIGVLGGAVVLAHHVLAIDFESGPGSHPETSVDVAGE
jgi:hypothetical protein